jgi:hypothetical protein
VDQNIPSAEAQQRLLELIEKFDDYLGVFNQANLFTGPSLYFHHKTIALLKTFGSVEAALNSDQFIESIYATLTAWGMHRMGKTNAKLAEFNQMRDSLRAQCGKIAGLQHLRLLDLACESVQSTANKLWQIIDNLQIGIGQVKIVAGSKALHHILPDLIPPIDRQYTLQFIYSNKHINRSEASLFQEIYTVFYQIAAGAKDSIRRAVKVGGGMNTSPTKVIDTAIVGYVLRNVKNTRKDAREPEQPQVNPTMTRPLQITAEPRYRQILRAVKALVQRGARTFSRNDVRLQLGLDSHEWLYGYTAIFQAMREDQPGGAPNIPDRYRGVFRRIERGVFQLTLYGVPLLEEEFDEE